VEVHTQGVTIPGRYQRLRREGPQSPAGKLAVLALASAALGYFCARLIVLLADVRPYTGWSWLLAVAGGIVIAVAVPWALVRGLRGSARWPGWLLGGYVIALVVGMRYYLSLRFTRPPPGSAPAPPRPRFVLEMAGLSAVTLTIVVITLIVLVATAEVIAPGPVGGRIRAWRERRESANRHSGPVDERFPTRLRPHAPGAAPGPWLRGEIRVRPGSVLWEPAAGVHAVPTELVAAAITPASAGHGPKRRRTALVDTPAGRAQLEFDAAVLATLQRIAADLARSSHVQTMSPQKPGQPADPV
jgi:hypothetical protein